MGDMYEMGMLQLANEVPITLTAFDPSEELVWSASQSGMIFSHTLPGAEPYSAFHIDKAMTPALGIFPNPYGLIAIAHDRVCFYEKGGLMQADVRLEQILGVTCGALSPSGAQLALCTALERPRISMFDVSSAQISASIELNSPASIARFEPRSSILCVGGTDDTIAVFDVRSGAKAVSTVSCFRGKGKVVCDFDVSGNSIAASGLRSQLGPFGQVIST